MEHCNANHRDNPQEMHLNTVRQLALIALVTSSEGCATGLSAQQKQEYQAYEAQGVVVQEKHPGVGAALGILPGGGGVVNFLMWPWSIMWDPVSGYEGSLAINYYATQANAPRMANELSKLDDQLDVGLITKEQYSSQKRLPVAKYTQ